MLMRFNVTIASLIWSITSLLFAVKGQITAKVWLFHRRPDLQKAGVSAAEAGSVAVSSLQITAKTAAAQRGALASAAAGRGFFGQSGRGRVPRRSGGTWQLSTRWASDALSERRSFNVWASCAIAGGTDAKKPAQLQPTNGSRSLHLTALSECQIDAAIAGQRIFPFGKRRHAVINEAIGPPQTTTSPLSSPMRRGRSLRLLPPNRKIAGNPRETETIGAVRSRSFSSRCSDSRVPGSYRLIRQASGSKSAESGSFRRSRGKLPKRSRHRGPEPCRSSGRRARSDSLCDPLPSPRGRNWSFATDIRNPPGVTILRNGADAVISVHRRNQTCCVRAGEAAQYRRCSR